MHYHGTATQSRSAWTEQEDELLRQAVAKFGDRAWATVANDVPGRSSKSCSDRWRNFLSPDIEHPRKSPFTEWEVAVVVQAQGRYGNNWKAISMLLPGRTNRAVKNLFVGNLKWGARLSEIRNRWLESNMTLEELLEIKPDHAGGPVKLKPGMTFPTASGSPSSFRAASTSSAGSAWASDMTDQPLSGSPASAGTVDRRKRGDGLEVAAGQSPSNIKRRRGAPSPVMIPQHYHAGSASYSPNVVPHPGAFGPGLTGSPILAGLPGGLAGLGVVSGMGPPGSRTMNVSTPTLALGLSSTGEMMTIKQRVSSNGSGDPLLLPNMQAFDQGSPSLAAAGGFTGYNRVGAVAGGRSSSMSALQGMPSLLMPGQMGMADTMVNRINSWHPGSVALPGIDMATAVAAGNGSNSPFAAMAGTALLSPPGSRAMSNLNPMRGMLKVEQGLEALDCSAAAGAFGNMQQSHCWAADLAAQQQMGHLQQQEQSLSQQQTAQLQHPEQHGHHINSSNCQQQDVEQTPPAALVPQAAVAPGIGLLPGSPTQLLQDMRSNDSAAFQQMLEQIFDEDGDDICISDPQTMHKLDGMMGGQQVPAVSAQQQAVAASQHAAGQVAETAAQAALVDLEANGSAPQRSNTWPNTWPNVAADGQAPTAAGVAHSGSSYGGAAPAQPSPVSANPAGVHMPPRSTSATGSGLNLAAAPGAHMSAGQSDLQQQQPQQWGWGQYTPQGATPCIPGHHSMPSSVPGSGPPSSGGFMPQQDMQALCHQLQQENMKLMAHVSKLQHRLNSHPNELPGPTDAAGNNLYEGTAASVVPAAPDSDLPRLPPVRVGGSSGGAAAAGPAPAAAPSWGVGVLDNEGSAGLDGAGSGGLGDLGVDLSPDGTFTPGVLLDDTNDGDLLSGI